MRRLSAVVMTLLALSFGASSVALAQYEDHPNVGVWINDDAPDDPANPLSLATVNADGTVRDYRFDGVSVGVWEPTGERTFVTTFLSPVYDEEAGFLGHITVRVEGEISEDGMTARSTYTVEFPDDPRGVFPPPGEWGPIEAVSTRLEVEAPGVPNGPWPPQPDE